MKKKIVPVVFAADNSYAYYCYMAVCSLIRNASPENEYHIYILFTDMDADNVGMIEGLKCDFIKVLCMDVSLFFNGAGLKGIKHLSVATYFRLFIPVVLSQYDKILYLDSDLIILEDVANLYKTELEGFPVGFVHEVESERVLSEHYVKVGNINYKNTFNAGVMLIDTKCFENEHIRERCIELLQEDFGREERKFTFADQDALNVVLYNHVKWLDPKWNVEVQFIDNMKMLDKDYRDEYLINVNRASIYHFPGIEKPWSYPLKPKAYLFWDNVKKTPYLTHIIDKELQKVRINKFPTEELMGYVFPYSSIQPNSRVVIYGAGIIGRAFVSQLRLGGFAKVVMWCDKNSSNFDKKYEIRSIEAITDIDFDYVVVAIKDNRVYEEVRVDLLRLGICDKDIVWEDYKPR